MDTRKALTKLSVYVLLVTLSSVAAGLSSTPKDVNLPTLQEVATRRLTLGTLDGKSVPIAELVGSGRPVVVEFWATWCVPCRKTLPHLVRLRQKYGEELVVLGLAVEDPTADATKVQEYVKQQHVNYTIAFSPKELFQYMNNRTDIAVPKLFVYDRTGRMVAYIPRYSPLTPRKLESAVKEAISKND